MTECIKAKPNQFRVAFIAHYKTSLKDLRKAGSSTVTGTNNEEQLGSKGNKHFYSKVAINLWHFSSSLSDQIEGSPRCNHLWQ